MTLRELFAADAADAADVEVAALALSLIHI